MSRVFARYFIALGFTALMFISACGGGGSSSVTSPDTSSTGSLAETPTDELCTPVGSLLDCELEHGGLDRRFKIYEPINLSPDAALPVLFNFHGYGSNADQQLIYGDFRSLADEETFVLVVPQGSLLEGTTHWNSDSEFTSKSTADDLGFVSRMIDELETRYNIDNTRVYAAGMSNGGAMSLYLACSLSDQITAVASVTGFMSADLLSNCGAVNPTSVILIHGTADSVVSWESGLGGGSILGIGEFWAEHNNCSQSSQTALEDYNGDGVSGLIHQHSGCDAETLVQVYEITDMDHIWPESRRGDDVDGARIVWDFLKQFSG